VSDGEAESEETYTMNIGVNAAPVAEDSPLTVTEGEPKTGTMQATDMDDTDLDYVITKQPEHGKLELIRGGPDYVYTPDPFYHGPDSFEFKATDQTLESEVAKVDITVDPVNTAPHSWTVKPGAIMVDGKVKAIQVANFFGDVDAFDPSKRGFSDSVDKLYSENAEQGNRFPARAKFRDIPLEGQLTFDVDLETLPPGLTFDGQKISGRPQVGGEFPIRMIATDGRGATAESIYTLFVGMPVTEPVIETPTTEPEPREEVKPEEKTPDLADHDLPKVLKVNPKRDATIPLREQITPEPVVDESAAADVGNAAGLADDNWMNTTVSSEQDVSGNIRVIDLKVEGDEIAVQITDEAVDQAETFKGEMADGSKLPDWVKVDPGTGLTTAEPPQGAASIEMRVIAEDSSGNERAIDLVLNPEALREQTQESEKTPREERREERQERREARQVERQARIEAREERRAERAENRAIREITRANTEVRVLSDGRVQFAEGLTAAGEGAMKLMRMVAAPEAVTIEITDEARVETTRYEIRQQDGTAAPDWVQVNAATGELIIEAEQNTGTLQLTLVAVDGSEQRSIDLEVNLDEMREDEDEQIEEVLEGAEEIEAGEPTALENEPLSEFVPLDAQIDAALAENNYGQVLQTAMQSRV
ncbi:MAG: putative Ig domain-containing protein, partial [Parvibaculales bacterium]